jgi:ribonuclease BN (tRNA processing enzyme)
MDVAKVAAEAGVKLLVLSHFSPIMDRPGVKERLLVEMSGVYSGPMLLGEDLMQIPLAVSFPNTLE